MENKTLISVRLQPSLLAKIDEITAKAGYLNRSYVISHLLTAFFECSVNDSLWRVLNSFDPYDDGIEINASTRQRLSMSH